MHIAMIWSRALDRKIAVGLGYLLAAALASGIGTLLPNPALGVGFTLINSFLTGALLIVVWSAFRLVRPLNYSRAWRDAEVIAVPLLWGFLVLVFALWSAHQHAALDEEFSRVIAIIEHLNKL